MIAEGHAAAGRSLAGRRLVVFMTRGVTLADWRRIGMLDRELALYRRLVEAGLSVTLISEGSGPEERAVARELAPIRVACNHRSLPGWVYRRLWPWLHRRVLAECDVIKTNQTDGGDAARRAARRFGKPLVARCGYMLSDFRARRFGQHDRRTVRARQLETRLFADAARVQVTTPAMARDLQSRAAPLGPALADRLRIVPNYVDTARFCPTPPATPPAGRDDIDEVDVVFVGRNSPQKNLPALLRAVADLPVRVLLIGTGTAEDLPPAHRALLPREAAAPDPVSMGAEGSDEIETKSKTPGGARIQWAGQVPHAALPAALRRGRVFVMPSLYEGHPKALIEAMACGLAVVAADRPGLAEVVEHERTGLLCEPTPEALCAAIGRLLQDPALRQRLGAAARSAAVQRYSLDRVLELETAVLQEAIEHG